MMKRNLGAFYDETSDFQQAQFNHLVSLIRKHLEVETIDSLLDIGSGTGSRTRQCLDIFPNLDHITAIEPDPDMYAQGISQHADPKIKYLKKTAAFIQHMNMGTRHFDMVLAHWVLHWIKDKDSLFSSLERVIDKESLLVFSTCERLPQILVDLDEYVRIELKIPPQGESPYYYLDRAEWENLLQQNNWNIKCIEAFEVTHHVNNAEEYLEHWFTASTAKFTYNRDFAEVSESSRKDMVSFMESKYGSDTKDGGLSFTEDVLFVIAEK